MTDRKIGIAIPTWNRVDLLIESFSKVLSDNRVEQINICDDASDLDIFKQIKSITDVLNSTHNHKITLSRNLTNQDCFRNKMHSVFGVSAGWVILLDSDNIIDTDYLDVLYQIEYWDSHTIYTPCFAEPNFDFRQYSGITISKENVSDYIDKPMFETALNAANYFIHKDTWLSVWDDSVNPITSDSIYVCLKWLEAGNKIKFVDGLRYFHRVHSGSHYQNNVSKTLPGFHESILNKLRNLR